MKAQFTILKKKLRFLFVTEREKKFYRPEPGQNKVTKSGFGDTKKLKKIETTEKSEITRFKATANWQFKCQ